MILLRGEYTLFEKVLAVLISFMRFSFFFALFFVFPLPQELIRGLIFKIPEVKGGRVLAAAFVGTTMASATFLSRALFVQGKGWTIDNLKTQRNDAIVAACLILLLLALLWRLQAGAYFEKE